MVHDLRQRLARELLQLRIGAILDLLFEQLRISLLILDLAIHIIPVERGTTVRLERENHRVSVLDGMILFCFRITFSASTTGMCVVTIRWA
jgi:hypothetical protein